MTQFLVAYCDQCGKQLVDPTKERKALEYLEAEIVEEDGARHTRHFCPNGKCMPRYVEKLHERIGQAVKEAEARQREIERQQEADRQAAEAAAAAEADA